MCCVMQAAQVHSVFIGRQFDKESIASVHQAEAPTEMLHVTSPTDALILASCQHRCSSLELDILAHNIAMSDQNLLVNCN